MNISFEDEFLLIVEKPAGVPCESRGDEATVLTMLSGEAPALHNQLFLLHRLDREVGGLMAFAKTKESASFLSREITEGPFVKEYLAVIDGTLQQQKGELTDLLFHDSRKNRSYVVQRPRKGVREAKLQYDVLGVSGEKSLLRVRLFTGRTHQIRVQFSSRGTPLCGDRRYGSKENTAIALWSYRLTFCHPQSGEKLCFSLLPPVTNEPWGMFGDILQKE